MRTIRPNVFETNSSSDHLICFPSATFCENLKVPEGTELDIQGEGEYGWGYDELTTPEQLLDYWLVSVKMHCPGKYTALTRNEIIEYFNGRGVKLYLQEDLNSTDGYIDHQSINEQSRMLANFIDNPQALFRFAFCPSTKIIIDTDNR